MNVDGYRDFRGVPVVGAWKRVADPNLGVATELGTAESFHTLGVLRTAFGILMGLLALAALIIVLIMRHVAHQSARIDQAIAAVKQLGQYRIEEKLGEGGMGTVYKATHAMLRRPTAIKVLNTTRASVESIARFEREVQTTSRLNNPHTIAIYDYGRTGDGEFYYAMEFLDGMTLEDLVDEFGPQPEGRVIHILRQICSSLGEAHGLGLIYHRATSNRRTIF